MKIFKPELVCPAGNWSSLRTAVENGADSVYFGIKGLNMRNEASNFDMLEMKKIMRYLRENKKKGYLALNVVVYDQELDKVEKILKEAKAAKVDAVILWDLAVFSLAKKMGLRIHLSTQASVSNIAAVKLYSQLGARRIVLARECTLADIKQIVRDIQKRHIRCDIETFIHGAMCVSISGRCFLSQFSFAKSANRGECLQPCRRQFLIKETEGDTEYVVGQDYLLSPQDLCTVDFIDDLIGAGIKAFKIEGRMRAPEYIKVVTTVYRRAIDAYFNGTLTPAFKGQLKGQLASVYNRGFSNGFYFGQPRGAISRGLGHTYEKIFLGEVTRFFKKISVAEIALLNGSLQKGEQLLFLGASTPARITLAEELQLDHQFIEEAGRGSRVAVKIPFPVKAKDKVFLWRRKVP